jgi:hypothetical protein
MRHPEAMGKDQRKGLTMTGRSSPPIVVWLMLDRLEGPDLRWLGRRPTSSPGIVDAMNPKLKPVLLILGLLGSLLIVSQLVMGQLIVNGGVSLKLIKAHQHSGYLTVTVVLIYIALSLSAIASTPTRPKA